MCLCVYSCVCFGMCHFLRTVRRVLGPCRGATRELNIENGIKEIEDKWRFLRLDLSPYKHDRGHVLTSIDVCCFVFCFFCLVSFLVCFLLPPVGLILCFSCCRRVGHHHHLGGEHVESECLCE